MRTSSTLSWTLRGRSLTLFGFLLGIVFLMPALGLQAQPTIAWDKTIGGSRNDNLYSLQQTTDGGYILGGNSGSSIGGDKTESSRGGEDYWVVKLDAAGNKLWDRTFGGSESENFTSLQQTSDGGFILGGHSMSGISGDKTENSKGWIDFWVVKLDGSGNKLWDRTLGGSGLNVFTSLQQTSDGGYILGGLSDAGISGDKTESSRGGEDYWVVKLDAAGNKLWDRTFGGSGGDFLHSLQQTSDGGYILGGMSSSPISGDKSENSKGGEDYWVVKLDAAGNKLWDRTFGGSGTDILNSLQQTSDGGYILGGGSNSSISGDKTENYRGGSDDLGRLFYDFWILKLDAAGDKLWDRTFGGSGTDVLHSLQQTSYGGYILGGLSDAGISGDKSENSREFYDFWVVKLNEAGNKLWDKTLGGNRLDYLYSLQQTSDGGYILGGMSNSPISGDKTQDSRGGYDFWIVKLNPEGEVPPQLPSFTLIDADSDRDLQTLSEGDVIDLSTLPTTNLNVRLNLAGAAGSVVFRLDNLPRVIENHAPYALGGDNYPDPDDYLAYPLLPGTHRLTATAYANTYGKGAAGPTHTVNFTVVGARIEGFTLVNADTDEDVMELKDGDVIDYGVLGTGNVNIRANTFPDSVRSVVFRLDGKLVRRENILPYALGGDNYPNVQDYHAYPLAPGNHTLTATAHSGHNGSGAAVASRTVSFTVAGSGSAFSASAASGGANAGLSAFPNPFTDKLTLQTGIPDEPVRVTLVDQLGRTVYQKEFASSAGAMELDVSGSKLEGGMYFLRLTSAGGTRVLKLMRR